MLETLDKALALRGSPLFADLEPEALLPIAELATPAALAAGDKLFAVHAAGDAAYVVVRGRLKIQRAAGGDDELGPGEIVGEMAAIDGGTRSATVSALTACELLRFERDHLLDVLLDHPAVSRALAAVLAARLRAERP